MAGDTITLKLLIDGKEATATLLNAEKQAKALQSALAGPQVTQATQQFNKMNLAVGQFGYVLSDANMFMVNFRVGMMSVANNIPQLVQFLQYAKDEAKATGTSFKDALTQSIKGPGGLLLGINALMFALQVLPPLFDKLTSSSDQFKKQTQELTSAEKAKEIQVKSLSASLLNNNISLEGRRNILKQIQDISPEYLKGIKLENESFDSLATKINKANQELEKRSKLLVEYAKLELISKQIADIQIKDIQPGAMDYLLALISGGASGSPGDAFGFAASDQVKQLAKLYGLQAKTQNTIAGLAGNAGNMSGGSGSGTTKSGRQQIIAPGPRIDPYSRRNRAMQIESEDLVSLGFNPLMFASPLSLQGARGEQSSIDITITKLDMLNLKLKDGSMLAQTFGDALTTAGRDFARTAAQGVALFRQANSVLEQMVNSLAQAITQMILMRAIDFGLSALGAAVPGLGFLNPVISSVTGGVPMWDNESFSRVQRATATAGTLAASRSQKVILQGKIKGNDIYLVNDKVSKFRSSVEVR